MTAVNPDPDAGLRERQRTIEARLRIDMRATIASLMTGDAPPEVLLDALVGDAMHQVDILLREVT